jgi:hypothetical protein
LAVGLVLKEALGLAGPAESFGLAKLSGASWGRDELCNVERGADRVRLVFKQSTRKACMFCAYVASLGYTRNFCFLLFVRNFFFPRFFLSCFRFI